MRNIYSASRPNVLPKFRNQVSGVATAEFVFRIPLNALRIATVADTAMIFGEHLPSALWP